MGLVSLFDYATIQLYLVFDLVMMLSEVAKYKRVQ
jgi:hypothetical protein